MPAPEWEDLSEFLDEDDFADRAIFTPIAEGDAFEVVGIFDDPYYNPELGEYDFDIREPRFTCAEADVANVQRSMICTIGTQTYQVEKVKPDGTGMAIVKLAEPQVYP